LPEERPGWEETAEADGRMIRGEEPFAATRREEPSDVTGETPHFQIRGGVGREAVALTL